MPLRDRSSSRNARHAETLINFSWTVAEQGHRIIEVPARHLLPTSRDRNRSLGPGSAAAGEHLKASGTPTRRRRGQRNGLNWTEPVVARVADLDGQLSISRTYSPPSATFGTFVESPGTPEGHLAFADAFGLLGRPVRFRLPGSDRIATGELLTSWDAEWRAMVDIVDRLREAIGADTPVPGWRYGDADALRRDIHATINQRLGDLDGGLSIRMLSPVATERHVLRMRPGSLIGAMWLELAHRVDAGVRFHRCPSCGGVISVHPDREIGRRSDAAYCSNACRQRAYRQKHTSAGRHLSGAPSA